MVAVVQTASPVSVTVAAFVGTAPSTPTLLAAYSTSAGASVPVRAGAAESIFAAVPPPAPVPPPPPGGEGLNRRVPGTHLSGLDVTLPSPDGQAPRPAGPVDPESFRRQVEDVERAVDRAQRVAEDGEPEPPPPPVAEVARRSGITRRVPGAALAGLDGTGSLPVPSPPIGQSPMTGSIDADLLRSELDAVDAALTQARDPESDESPTHSITEERRAAQAAEAARRAAAGRHSEQRAAMEELADGLVSGAVPLPAPAFAPTPASDEPEPIASGDEPIPAETPVAATGGPVLAAVAATAEPAEPAAPAAPAEPTAPRPQQALTRRVRGASLSAFSSGGAAARHAANGARTSASRTGPIAIVPERPEDVLAWASDLESTMPPAGSPGAQAARDGDGGADDKASGRTDTPSTREGEVS
jgi:hypothetical protein